MRRGLCLLAGVVMLGLLVSSFGCSGSEANPFLGKWAVNQDKTKEVNKALIEEDEMAAEMLMAILSEIKLEVAEKEATLVFGDTKETKEYAIKDGTMTLQMDDVKFTFKMLEDNKAMSMVNENAKKGELSEMILTRDEG